MSNLYKEVEHRVRRSVPPLSSFPTSGFFIKWSAMGVRVSGRLAAQNTEPGHPAAENQNLTTIAKTRYPRISARRWSTETRPRLVPARPKFVQVRARMVAFFQKAPMA